MLWQGRLLASVLRTLALDTLWLFTIVVDTALDETPRCQHCSSIRRSDCAKSEQRAAVKRLSHKAT